jgi:AcrR family transcriptional regulator
MVAKHKNSRMGRPVDRSLPQRRREEILGAATSFFSRHGYHEADIEALAEELGIGKGTIYRYFRTKERLFRAALARGITALHAAVAAETTARPGRDDGLEVVCRAIAAYFAYFERHPQLIELMVIERAELKDRGKPTYFSLRERYLGPWRRRLRGLMAQGAIRRMEVETITSCLGMLMYGALVAHPFLSGRRGLAAQARGIIDVVLHGIRARDDVHRVPS